MLDTYGQEFSVPDFTMKEVYEAIPQRCFQRSALRSFGYVARDLVLALALGFAAYGLIPMLPASRLVRFAAWALYAFCQGCVGTGLWVLAHECGHQAFSTKGWLNDAVGWILHSALLVPYFSWKYSHGKHHKATGNLAKDTVFVPKTRSSIIAKRGCRPEDFPEGNDEAESRFCELVEETPLMTLFQMIVQQLGGWPSYLLCNITGQRYPDHPRWKVNHFYPFSPLYSPSAYKHILLSDLGVGIAATILYSIGKRVGLFNLILFYFIPYLWVNHWLVLITYLQHTDPALPHYREGKWTFERGAAATIDRDFGFIGRHIFHKIIETHVAHHLCSRIPFYYAEEATGAVKKVLGSAYQRDDTNIFLAAWRTARLCQWVNDSGDIVFYKNANGLGLQ